VIPTDTKHLKNALLQFRYFSAPELATNLHTSPSLHTKHTRINLTAHPCCKHIKPAHDYNGESGMQTFLPYEGHTVWLFASKLLRTAPDDDSKQGALSYRLHKCTFHRMMLHRKRRNFNTRTRAGLWVGRAGPLPRALTTRGRRKGSHRPATR
jgi:hypothetical protein